MAGFLDVLLRGLMLTGGAVALGGVVVARMILGGGPGLEPEAAVRRALRGVALGAVVVAVAQLGIAAIAAGALAAELGAATLATFALTPFALTSAARVVVAAAAAAAALVLARRPGGALGWTALSAATVALVASSAGISHAAARLDGRTSLLVLDAVHQLAAAVWVGGLVHLLVVFRGGVTSLSGRVSIARFSTIALVSVAVLIAAGFGLSFAYVGDARALLETAYGVMVLTKAVLLAAILAFGYGSFRLVRRAASRATATRLIRFVEVEAGLALTVLFAAASLTSVPPAVDVREDRATVREVAARFTAMPPRFASPDVSELLRQTNPASGRLEARLQIEREWSESNHHWAGLVVLAMGLAAMAQRAGVRAARHWPLLLVVLALLLVARNDPEVWPLGPVGLWESLAQAEVLQHRLFMLLIVVFGAFEWAVRTERVPARPWAYVFPALCAVGGGLLLTHSHTVFSLKEAFLMEVTHAPIGVLSAFAGWARWLELRLPEAAPSAGRIWPACLAVVGVLLIFYSEG